MTELVLAINRSQLVQQGINSTGLHDFDFEAVHPSDYALLPRDFADNKSENAILLGSIFPQILGYFQIVRPDGRILCYQRKGKEKGLLGKWSLGVGGHVSQEDLHEVESETGDEIPDLATLVYCGALREIHEELGITPEWIEELGDVDSFTDAANKILATMVDPTSSVHVGLPVRLHLPEHIYDAMKLDPAEFLNYQWLTEAEIKSGDREWETWSNILIKNM